MPSPNIVDAVSEAREIITSRVAELEEELGHLQRALVQLDGAEPSASGGGLGPRESKRRSKPKARKPVRGSRRAKRGQRRTELLAAIKKMPQATVPELADAVGIPAGQVYGLVRKAEADNRITKKGQGFVVKSEGEKDG